jgi:hypothetical protein
VATEGGTPSAVSNDSSSSLGSQAVQPRFVFVEVGHGSTAPPFAWLTHGPVHAPTCTRWSLARSARTGTDMPYHPTRAETHWTRVCTPPIRFSKRRAPHPRRAEAWLLPATGPQPYAWHGRGPHAEPSASALPPVPRGHRTRQPLGAVPVVPSWRHGSQPHPRPAGCPLSRRDSAEKRELSGAAAPPSPACASRFATHVRDRAPSTRHDRQDPPNPGPYRPLLTAHTPF